VFSKLNEFAERLATCTNLPDACYIHKSSRLQMCELTVWKFFCLHGLASPLRAGFTENYKLAFYLDDTMILLAGHRTCDSQVMGSRPSWKPPHSGLGEATYTCTYLCRQAA